MLKSILGVTKKSSGAHASALLGALSLLLVGLTVPTQAQELETFDPDEVFDASVPSEVQEADTIEAVTPPTDILPDAGAVETDIIEPGFRRAPGLDPVAGMPAPTDRTPDTSESGDWANNAQAVEGEPAPQWVDPAEGEAVASSAGQSGTYKTI